jgi:hypothetical protein
MFSVVLSNQLKEGSRLETNFYLWLCTHVGAAPQSALTGTTEMFPWFYLSGNYRNEAEGPVILMVRDPRQAVYIKMVWGGTNPNPLLDEAG